VSSRVFSGLVGQSSVISTLESAVHAAHNGSTGQEMTHAWLFTGPPGSGRSNAAKAFAAALVCNESGCGECSDCITALVGTHPDVEIVDVSGISIKIDEIREVVSRSAWGASISKWRIVVIEDCDRMTEAAANALLKAVEEPGGQTIWLLCAPTLQDVIPTIRSRCRHLNLKTPSAAEIASYLRDSLGANQEDAELAARISQGHIGKARGYLQDPSFQEARKKSFEILFHIKSEGSAILAASKIVELANERAELRTTERNEIEREELKAALQSGSRGLVSGGAKALKDLERDQKARVTRLIKDEIDGVLLDYATFLRDCLTGDGPFINTDLEEEISRISSTNKSGQIAEALVKLNQTRELLATNAAQLLLVESFLLHFLPLNRGN
jgi:DNA polymerase-3 subunit delta'